MRKFLFDTNGSNNSTEDNRRLAQKLKLFRVTQNKTPKMEKLSVFTKKVSHCFAEHAWI